VIQKSMSLEYEPSSEPLPGAIHNPLNNSLVSSYDGLRELVDLMFPPVVEERDEPTSEEVRNPPGVVPMLATTHAGFLFRTLPYGYA